MSELNEGVKLEHILFEDDSELKVGSILKVGSMTVIDITVTMENGQMARVPWAAVSFENGNKTLINLSQVSSVQLATTEDASDE